MNNDAIVEYEQSVITQDTANNKICNIVQLIEKNPITKISNMYQNKLISKIKNKFNEYEQQVFVASFYCYLNYDKSKDYVIDLDNVWEWLGFYKKANAKQLLEKYFEEGKHYKYFAADDSAAKSGRGGHNKIQIIMTVETFKSLCLKTSTKKANQIHEYYLKLEEILQEVVNEETAELKIQLQEKDKLLQNAEIDKMDIKEKTLIEQFPNNVQCIYYGIIDNTSSNNEKLVKFGCSNFLANRIESHKKTFSNFHLLNAFKVDNKVLVENAIKKHPVLSTLRRTVRIDSVCHNELLSINNLSIQELDAIIKHIIITMEYNPEKYKKLLDEYDKLSKLNIDLVKEIDDLKTCIQTDNTDDNIKVRLLLLHEENQKLKNENMKLLKQYKMSDAKNICISSDNIMISLKRITKSNDGLYHIGDQVYKQCHGSREQVWGDVAYKTAGGLTKSDLILNKHGKVISKKKFISEKMNNHLAEFNSARILKGT